MSGPGGRPTCRPGAGVSLASPAFARAEANQGFDRDARPPWQMIPELGHRLVYLQGEGTPLSDFSFRAYPPDLVTVEYEPYDARGDLKRGILLVGRQAGTGYLLASQRTNPICTARLDIAVKTQKTVTVYFQFVADNVNLDKRKTGASTTRRSIDHIEDILAAANRILTPQANVKLHEAGRKHLLLAEDLGPSVQVSRALDNLPTWDERELLFRHAHKTADFNVFFVRDLQRPGSGRHDLDGVTVTVRRDTTIASLAGNAPVYRANCIIEDRLGSWQSMDAALTGRVLAHEVGHFLMFNDTNPTDAHHYHGQQRPSSHLMNGDARSRGLYIPKDDANRMNPD